MRDLPEKLRWIVLIFNHLKNTWIKPEITRKISYNKKYSTAMEECLIYFWFEHVPFVVAYTKLYRANQILFQHNSGVSDICNYIIFNIFFSVSVSKTTPFVSNDLEKIGGKGITLK